MKSFNADSYRTIGILLDLTQDYGRNILRGIRQFILTCRNWELNLISYTPTARLWDSWPMSNIHFDGIIGHFTTQEVVEKVRLATPNVISVSNQKSEMEVPRVLSDDVEIGRLAARHFLERGFTSFSFIGTPEHSYAQQRYQGFAEVLEKANCSCTWLSGLGYEKIVFALQQKTEPQAVFCASDLGANRLINQLVKSGVAVPEQVAVIGVDDDSLECDLSLVPISSVAPNKEKIGFEAAALMDRMIRGEKPSYVPIRIPPRELIIRRSSDVYAITDPLVAKAVNFIHHHAPEIQSIPQIANAMQVTRRMLERRFRAALGRTVYEEVLHAQITRVQKLLIETDLKLGEIAALSGLTDGRRLSVVFKRLTGQTPGNYRLENQKRKS